MENIYYNLLNNLLQNKYQGNIQLFLSENSSLKSFLRNTGNETTLMHFPITEEQYEKIITKIKEQYKNQINNEPQINIEPEQIQQQDKPKVMQKVKPKNNKIAGFVDALIIAFITGSFIGIILLNIYSKIAQHI